jgi:hypothetical protein
MPLFALANAGVDLSIRDIGNPVTLAVFVGFVLGKPIGVLSFTWVALRLRLATRPADLTWGLLAGAGLLAGIGFTMALFIATLAFSDTLMSSAKLGIFIASIASAAAGLAVLASFSRNSASSNSNLYVDRNRNIERNRLRGIPAQKPAPLIVPRCIRSHPLRSHDIRSACARRSGIACFPCPARRGAGSLSRIYASIDRPAPASIVLPLSWTAT